MEIILASSSPRRQQLLQQLGVEFRVVLPDPIDETAVLGDKSVELTARLNKLAMLKGDAIANQNPDSIVISGDTVVVLGDRILGKPADPTEAREMLRELSGNTHRVYSAFCCHQHGIGKKAVDTDCTEVTFRGLTAASINRYLSLVDVHDKAGAYAIQEWGELLVERIDGDLTTVIGLPAGLLCRQLRLFGIDVNKAGVT